MNYTITDFNPSLGQLTVELENGLTFAVDIPFDAQGQYVSGPDLDAYIRAMAPVGYLDRLQQISQGVSNSADIAALVTPTVTPVPTAEEMWERIKALRDKRKSGGVLVNGKWFHTDTASRIQWLGLDRDATKLLNAGAAPNTIMQKLGQNILWKTMDGSFVPVTVSLPDPVVEATGDLDAKVFAKAEQHRATMLVTTPPGAYDFTTGWPTVYGE